MFYFSAKSNPLTDLPPSEQQLEVDWACEGLNVRWTGVMKGVGKAQEHGLLVS